VLPQVARSGLTEPVRPLPSGTVTLLFSDMEGSTRLLSRLGAEYVVALDAQRQILRDAWTQHDGVELGTEGDSFFVVFDNAPAAVRAAVMGQRGLLSSTWPSGERVLVRMGLHTGSPMPHNDAYVGMDVHRAARVAGVAQGGQILVSDATAALAGAEGAADPEGFGFLDLGEHQLKDLPQPEHLFQVTAEGLPRDFSAVASLGSVTNLPPVSTPIIGREAERAQLSKLAEDRSVRLVTLTGPGGSGKTRLSTDVARRSAPYFPHGVYFVGLESARNADDMWTEIAAALDVPPESRLRPDLLEHITHKSSLLLLDNLEQVEGAGDVVKELLDEAPSLRILATSRHPLHVPGEHEFPVAPLPLPEADGLSAVEASPAVQLFMRQAQLVRPSFRLTEGNRTDIAAVCARLDGLPLALELAAARSKLLAPRALLRRLDEALDLRSAELGRSDRQQTLRHTIMWSYELLSEVEQRLFRCLSVFAGGAALDSVEMVWGQLDSGPDDTLSLVERLVDASLVVVTEGADDEPRVEMLNTVQAFAAEQLAASGEEDRVAEAAVRHFEELMQDPDRDGDFEARSRYLARLEVEHDNYRRSLEWLHAHLDGDEGESHTIRMLDLTAWLVGRLCRPRGYYQEGRRWCERALAATTVRDDVSVAACEIELASILGTCGEREAAVPILDHAAEILAVTVPGERCSEDSLEHLRSILLIGQAMAAHTMGRPDKARELYEMGLATFRDPLRRGHLLHNYAAMIGATEGPAVALEYERKTAELFKQAGDENMWVFARHNAACSLRELGRTEEAQQEMAALFPSVVATRIPEAVFVVAEDYASVMSDLGRYEETALLMGAACAMRDRVGVPLDPPQEAELEKPLGRAREALGPRWDELMHRGGEMSVEKAMQETGDVAAFPVVSASS
jgi:predicted ATPase/class 3 adenylate cyclase